MRNILFIAFFILSGYAAKAQIVRDTTYYWADSAEVEVFDTLRESMEVMIDSVYRNLNMQK